MAERQTAASTADAIEYAQENYTMAPDSGLRFTDRKTQAWSGWRVSFIDTRGRRVRKSFLLYDEHVTREVVDLAIAAWFNEVGR